MLRNSLYLFLVNLLMLPVFSIDVTGQKLPVWDLGPNPVFFTGVNHLLNIRVNESNPEFISAKNSLGYMNQISDTVFQIRFDMVAEDVKLRLFYKKLPVDIVTATVLKLEAPKVLLLQEPKEQISVSETANIQEVIFRFEPDIPENLASLHSFRMSIREDGVKRPYTIQLTQSRLDEQLLQTIRNIKPGGSITIDNVLFITPERSILNIPRNVYQFNFVK
jgi:hypothetical protein